MVLFASNERDLIFSISVRAFDESGVTSWQWPAVRACSRRTSRQRERRARRRTPTNEHLSFSPFASNLPSFVEDAAHQPRPLLHDAPSNLAVGGRCSVVRASCRRPTTVACVFLLLLASLALLGKADRVIPLLCASFRRQVSGVYGSACLSVVDAAGLSAGCVLLLFGCCPATVLFLVAGLSPALSLQASSARPTSAKDTLPLTQIRRAHVGHPGGRVRDPSVDAHVRPRGWRRGCLSGRQDDL